MEINIDISNYEEYLLSAVDGELSGEEMAALEVFLQQYPHIREELVLLESVKIMPDDAVQFNFKSELYHESIQMLDYVDGELHGAEKQAFEELLLRDAGLSKELNLLQRARLQPDLNLLFEDKASLYKHNRHKIRPVWWWSAAAAVVAGVAVWILPALPGKEQHQVAVNTQPAANQNKTTSQSSTEKELLADNAIKNNISKNKPEMATAANTNNKQAAADKTTANNPLGNATANNKEASANKTTANNSLANATANNTAVNKITVNNATANNTTADKTIADNSNPSLSKLAQPVPTSKEVVQQLQDKLNEQKEQVIAEAGNPAQQKAPVMANSTAISTNTNKVAEAVAAAPVPGELVVSVTMNGDSKLLNGVANVARFFSKKKK
jgi:anti-sigma factor RsiW